MHPESRINILFLFLLTDSRLGHALLFWGAKATFYYLFIYFMVKEIIISLFNLQSSQVKRAPPPLPPDSINESIDYLKNESVSCFRN